MNEKPTFTTLPTRRGVYLLCSSTAIQGAVQCRFDQDSTVPNLESARGRRRRGKRRNRLFGTDPYTDDHVVSIVEHACPLPTAVVPCGSGGKGRSTPSGRSNDALAMLSANKQVHHLPSHIANPVPALFSSLPSPTILFAYGTFLPMLAGDNAAADLISLRILLVSARDLLRLT